MCVWCFAVVGRAGAADALNTCFLSSTPSLLILALAVPEAVPSLPPSRFNISPHSGCGGLEAEGCLCELQRLTDADRCRYALSESHPDRSSGGGYSLYGEADELDLFATGSSGISGASRSRFDSDYSLRHPSLSGEAEGEA